MKKFNSRAALVALLLVTAAPVNAICTPATINPGAPARIRPHMTPAAVSAVLGCAPTDIPPTLIGGWVWAVPLDLNPVGARMQVLVVFDAAGTLGAFYQFFPPDGPDGHIGRPIGNGAIRVEPSTPNWIFGSGPVR